MQSIKNIYEKIYDFENLHKAWEEARKGKRYREVEKKEEVSRCTGNCNNCPNYTESYFCGFATPYCKLQGKEITHNVY